MIKKIWKDPVGSKIISWLIIGAITLIAIKIKSSYDNESLKQTFYNLINFKVKIIYILICILIAYILFKIFKTKKSGYSKSQKKLRDFNKSLDKEQGLLLKWVVYFKRNGNPFITDLEIFCNEHGEVPIRFVGNNCSVRGCKNSRLNIDTYKVENHVESIVVNEWDNMQK